MIELLQRIWKEGNIPKDWKKSIIVLIYKKGNQDKAENYRGISLLCSAYKVYAEVLRNRLEKKTEDRNLLPESQCGFRKGRSNLENVFILSHLVQREKKKEEDKVYTVFIDLKTAFDKVDREILWRTLEGKGIDKEVIWRIKKIYEGTEATIMTEDGFSKAFS